MLTFNFQVEPLHEATCHTFGCEAKPLHCCCLEERLPALQVRSCLKAVWMHADHHVHLIAVSLACGCHTSFGCLLVLRLP